MEIDAINVLKFMASNGLVANPKKTTMLFVNLGNVIEKEIKIKIGKEVITQARGAKLLGVNFDDNLKWKSQIYGKGGMLPSLNQRLFVLRRLKNFVNNESLKKVADSIFTSKIRYGLQLLGKVRWSALEVVQGDLDAIQKVQNKMVRLLNGKTLADKINTKVLLNNINMLSVNQLNAQTKITEVWKAITDSSHPLKIEKISHDKNLCTTRAVTKGDLVEFGKTKLVQSTYLSDASRIWNKCPESVKTCTTLWSAKKAIKTFVKTLPI